MILAVAVAGCTTSTAPSPLYPGYYLTQIDDQYLPVPFAEDGTQLIASGLAFTDGQRPRPDQSGTGLVNYSITVRPPGGSAHTSIVQLEYSIENATLTINLCPPLALCITTDVLTGSLPGSYQELVLTRVLAGTPRSTYRFSPVFSE